MIPELDVQSPHSLPTQQAATQPSYVTSHCNHTPVTNDEVNPDTHFFESHQEFGTPDSVKDGSDDGEDTIYIHGDGIED